VELREKLVVRFNNHLLSRFALDLNVTNITWLLVKSHGLSVINE
jgi:hypothetical protein